MASSPAFTRRPERPEDSGFRFDLFRLSRQPGETLEGFDPGLADCLLRHQFAGQEASYRSAHPAARHDIIEGAGAPVGRIVLDEGAEAWTLVDIALMPAARGRGIGTAVLRAVCEAADRAGAPLRLTVRAGSPAHRLYGRLGFVATHVSAFGAEMVRPVAAPRRQEMPDRLRLPLRFEAARLAAECGALEQDWIRHFVTMNYDGDWSVIPLRAKAGATHPVMMIYADATCRDFADTPILAACPGLRAVLDSFACPLEAVRLMRLGPGSIIKAHADHDLSFEEGFVRIHVPIISNPGVVFRLNGTRVVMEPGSAWYLRLCDPHSVENHGTTARVHLVIDALVNPWVEALFQAANAQAGRGRSPARGDHRAAR